MQTRSFFLFRIILLTILLAACGLPATPLVPTATTTLVPLSTGTVGPIRTSLPSPTVTGQPTETASSTPITETSSLYLETRIAFTDGGHIFLMDYDGSNLKILATEASGWGVRFLDLSADGMKIVYKVEPSLPLKIYIINADGSGLRQLPTQGEIVDWPGLSPDGEWVAYMSNVAGRHEVNFQSHDHDILLLKTDGSSSFTLVQNEYSNGYPSWSPDGGFIAYTTHRRTGTYNDPTYSAALYIVSASGGESRLVYETADDYLIRRVMWSPDGNTIAFIMGDGGTHYDIYTIQPDGSGLERITYSGTFWEDIFWLPDSLHIGYWSRYRSEDPERRFEVIDIISKEVVEIETPAFEALNQSRAYAPDWSLPPRPYIELPDCSSGWTRLVAGGQARVMGAKNDPPNRVRSEPAQGENIIGEISPGRIVRVTEGPVCVDGLVYWKVYNAVIPGGSGWTAEGDGTEYWLEPYLP